MTHFYPMKNKNGLLGASGENLTKCETSYKLPQGNETQVDITISICSPASLKTVSVITGICTNE